MIFEIQHFCIHDGDGIRTTVFFKGCPLRCSWCHNPEGISQKYDMLYDTKKCTLCLECVQRCPNQAISFQSDKTAVVTDLTKCNFCGNCVFYCINLARDLVGIKKTVAQIVQELVTDIVFYEESHGGVTLSGGEPLLQIDFVEQLLICLKKRGINTAVDTCGYVPFTSLERVAKYTDTFLFDLKILDSKAHKQHTGVANELILANLQKLATIHNDIHLRMPIVKGVNDNEEHIEKVLQLMLALKLKRVSILPYHNMSEHKYTKLGLKYSTKDKEIPSIEYLENVRKLYENHNIQISIGG